MSNRTRNALLLALLIGLLALLLRRPGGRSDEPAEAAAPAPPARGPAPGEPAPERSAAAESAPPVGPEPACDEARGELAAVLAAAEEDCAADLLASRCVPPLEYPLWLYWGPERQAEIVEEQVAKCPDLPRDAVALECSEFPCLLLIRWEHLEMPTSCAPLDELAGRPDLDLRRQEAEGADDFRREWAVFHQVAPSTQLAQVFGPALDQRTEARVAAVERWLSTRHDGAFRLDGRPDCAEVHALLDLARSGGSCAAARRARSCPADAEPSIPPELVQHHIEEAERVVEELAARCPSLAERRYVVDCSDVPCVLAVDAPEGVPWPADALCGDPLIDDLDLVTAILHPNLYCDQTAIIPLWDAGGLAEQSPEAEENYWRNRSRRTSDACVAVQQPVMTPI